MDKRVSPTIAIDSLPQSQYAGVSIWLWPLAGVSIWLWPQASVQNVYPIFTQRLLIRAARPGLPQRPRARWTSCGAVPQPASTSVHSAGEPTFPLQARALATSDASVRYKSGRDWRPRSRVIQAAAPRINLTPPCSVRDPDPTARVRRRPGGSGWPRFQAPPHLGRYRSERGGKHPHRIAWRTRE